MDGSWRQDVVRRSLEVRARLREFGFTSAPSRRDHSSMIRCLSWALLGACTLLCSARAYGQEPSEPARAGTGAHPPGTSIRLSTDVTRRLRSDDPAQIKGALDEVRTSGKAGVV